MNTQGEGSVVVRSPPPPGAPPRGHDLSGGPAHDLPARAAPPPARGGPCSCPAPPAARAARPPGTRPAAPPSRSGAIAPAALFAPVDGGKRKRNARRHCNRPAGPRCLPAGLRPPVAWRSLGLVVCGRARRGPPWSAPAGCAARPGTGGDSPPAQVVGINGAGPGGTAGRPPCGLQPSPRGGGVVFGGLRPPRGVAASPWPTLARPRLWSILGGAPPSPAARVGPAVPNGCVPWRRQAPAPSVAPGPPGGRAQGPPPSEEKRPGARGIGFRRLRAAGGRESSD